MTNLINLIKRWFGIDPGLLGGRRSPDWPAVRKQHLKKHPYCEITGTTKKLEVHHVRPYHLYPELELDPENLITLSGKKVYGVKSHQFFGHYGNFKKHNPNVREDAAQWKKRLTRGLEK